VGLALAAINSIDTLISIAYLETLDGKRVEPNRVLRGLGLANLFGGLLGGLPTAPSNGRVLIGHQAGARDWRGPLAGGAETRCLSRTMTSSSSWSFTNTQTGWQPAASDTEVE